MKPVIWKHAVLGRILVGAAFVALLFVFSRELSNLVRLWSQKEEYSHGFFIPLISAFLIWQKSQELRAQQFQGAWWGVVVVGLGLVLLFMGRLGAVYDLGQYGFVIALYGLALALLGWRGVKLIWAPLFILVLMLPLPQFLYNNLSLQLQLLSSWLGVAFLRLFDISVYLEGNVIDLGTFKLQVVDACSGLRYLFPLTTLAFLVAYFYNAALWKRFLVFFSSIPITILMNSFRIGAIGILVEYWGIQQAQGFLHYFEGWVIFMACLGLLFLEILLLERFSGGTGSLSAVFGVTFPNPPDPNSAVRYRTFPKITLVVIAITIMAGLAGEEINQREPAKLERADFSEFPMTVGSWKGRSENLAPIYLKTLQLDDYLLVDYQRDDQVVNLYVAYYSSQQSGAAVHSPRSCLPGGGWEMVNQEERIVGNPRANGRPMKVNRVIIKKGEYSQLVYYWFQQRGRDITDEVLLRWYVLWDALKRHRTDGALIRLTTQIKPGEEISAADQRLTELSKEIIPLMPAYIPN